MYDFSMQRTRSSTPCLGICSTTYGDDVCRGCKRFVHEVINWNSYKSDEKESVNSRLEQFKCTILKDKFAIIDANLFAKKLHENSIIFNDSLKPLTWIFDLLRASGSQSLNLEDFGVKVLPAFDQVPLHELKNAINLEFFELSQAHFDRYFISD